METLRTGFVVRNLTLITRVTRLTLLRLTVTYSTRHSEPSDVDYLYKKKATYHDSLLFPFKYLS